MLIVAGVVTVAAIAFGLTLRSEKSVDDGSDPATAPFVGKTFECRRRRDVTDGSGSQRAWRVDVGRGVFHMQVNYSTEWKPYGDGTWSYDPVKRRIDASMRFAERYNVPGEGDGTQAKFVIVQASDGEISVEQVPRVSEGVSEAYRMQNDGGAVSLDATRSASDARPVEDISMRCVDLAGAGAAQTPLPTLGPDPDAVAQSSLRNTLTSAKAIYTDREDYTDATPSMLQRNEPSLKFESFSTDSTGPSVVSVISPSRNEFAAAARATSRVCWLIRDVNAPDLPSAGTRWMRLTGERCSADWVFHLDDSDWTRTPEELL